MTELVRVREGVPVALIVRGGVALAVRVAVVAAVLDDVVDALTVALRDAVLLVVGVPLRLRVAVCVLLVDVVDVDVPVTVGVVVAQGVMTERGCSGAMPLYRYTVSVLATSRLPVAGSRLIPVDAGELIIKVSSATPLGETYSSVLFCVVDREKMTKSPPAASGTVNTTLYVNL